MDGKASPPHTLKRTNENGVRFLAALRDCPNVSNACRVVGISRHLSYVWRDDKDFLVDEGEGPRPFGELWKEAMEDGVEAIEVQAIRWAHGELLEPVLYKGAVMWQVENDQDKILLGECVTVHDEGGTKRHYKVDEAGNPVPLLIPTRNARMIELLLKGRKREVYGDKLDVQGAMDHKHTGGVLMMPAASQSEEEFLAEAREQQRQFREETR